MNLTQLSTQDAAVLGLIATLVAALIGAVAALVVSLITHWSSARLAASAARRDWRLRMVAPFVEYLDKRMELYERMTVLFFTDRGAFNDFCSELLSTMTHVPAPRSAELEMRPYTVFRGAAYTSYKAALDADGAVKRSILEFHDRRSKLYGSIEEAGGFVTVEIAHAHHNTTDQPVSHYAAEVSEAIDTFRKAWMLFHEDLARSLF